MQLHPIIQQSFAMIDQEIGPHDLSPAEYAIVRRMIHSSADFDFKDLVRFSPHAIAHGIQYLQQGLPVVTDVSMVAQGMRSMARQTFENPIINALELATDIPPGATRSETGILKAFEQYPQAIYVIGNAPTALIALCKRLQQQEDDETLPCLIVGVPVGFVSVIESKALLGDTAVEQIQVVGRKGGSPVGAAIMNALLHLAWVQKDPGVS